ncbi:zinc finger protein 391 [Drosophila guanche]|uniref:Zinc finger protein 865 n=1 Tax=Drosophila guanche TaxID=7266 RepID=A0A3B0K0Q6_DROGU|nr:zinc finger protein 391 [Drosophila guanche]SPP86913.1 blast:Zinc finger protein 235 [Drosophila guanche]
MMTTKAGSVVMNCRTCTRACKLYKSLQDEIEIGTEGTTTLANMLNYCSSLSFEPEDGETMPQHICQNCLQLLEQAVAFKRMVIDSDELLRQGLNEANDAFDEYVTVEMLTDVEVDNTKPDSSTTDESPAIMLENLNELQQGEEEFVIEEVAEQEDEQEDEHEIDEAEQLQLVAATAEHLEIETVHGYQQGGIQYEIKNEFGSLDTDEDEYEVIDEATSADLLDERMIVIHAEDAIEEIGEEGLEMVEEEAEDILTCEEEEIECEVEEADYLDESVEESTQLPCEPLPYVCKVCQKPFRQQCRLNQHMRSHIHEKLYRCDECGKKLKHLRNFKEHMLTHSNVKPHQCPICDRFYRTTSSLAAHKRTHAEEKPHTCEKCGRGYAALDHLKRHMLTHTGERPYACDLCDKAYYDSSSLRQHKVSHTGAKMFTCEICGVGLSQKSGYKKHMLVHSGAKPHKCHICGRAFTFTSNLNAHVRLHSGDKPFKCEICSKAFPTKKRLVSHLRVHNKESRINGVSNRSNTASMPVANLHQRAVGNQMPDITDQKVSNSKVVVVL